MTTGILLCLSNGIVYLLFNSWKKIYDRTLLELQQNKGKLVTQRVANVLFRDPATLGPFSNDTIPETVRNIDMSQLLLLSKKLELAEL